MSSHRIFYTDADGCLNQDYFKEQCSYTDPLHKGIKLEIDFSYAISNIPFYKKNSEIYISDNSAIDDPQDYDVHLYSFIGNYEFEVKGTDGNRIYVELTPSYIKSKLYLAEHLNCYFAFPDINATDLHDPENWFIHRITKNSYLTKLHSKPYYPKLIENSMVLSKLPFIPNDNQAEKEHMDMIRYFLIKSQNKKYEELLSLSEVENKYFDIGNKEGTNRDNYSQ